MSTNTSRLALTQPVGSDSPSALRTSIGGNATILDNAAIYGEGTLVGRGAASASPHGTFYYATDTDQVAVSNGTTWIDCGPVPVVTALPGSPYDGQEIRFLADSTNGIVWHLRYRVASASTYKWEFIGGSPLMATNDALARVASANSYQDPSAGGTGPSITLPTLPNGGDFDVEVGSWPLANSSHAGGVFMSYAVGGTAAIDNDAAILWAGESFNDVGASVFSRRRKTGVASAAAITAKYMMTGSFVTADVQWQYRTMTITPVRVG